MNLLPRCIACEQAHLWEFGENFLRRTSVGGGGVLGLIFAGYVPLASQSPYPISILWPIIDPILVTFVQISNFHDLSLVCFYFYELIHFLHRMKNTLLFICGSNILVRLLTVNMKNCNTPPKPENVRPHYSHSSRENATPSSGTSPLASCEGLVRKNPLPPPRGRRTRHSTHFSSVDGSAAK